MVYSIADEEGIQVQHCIAQFFPQTENRAAPMGCPTETKTGDKVVRRLSAFER